MFHKNDLTVNGAVMKGSAKTLKKLDNFFYDFYNKHGMTGSGFYDLADIVGVLIGVKPASVNYVFKFQMGDNEKAELEKMLSELGLKISFEDFDDEKNETTVEGGDKYNHYVRFYVSKDEKKIEELKKAFKAILYADETDERHRTVGELLGYPKTAIDYYLSDRDQEAEDEQRFQKGLYLGHYVHSLDHDREEFEQYEKPIYEVLKKYCPQSYRFVAQVSLFLPNGAELHTIME